MSNKDTTPEPLIYTFTEEGIQKAIVDYLSDLYRPLLECDNKDHWLERHGLLMGFADHLLRKK